MSLRGRLNHRASIYRPTGTVDRLGDVAVRPVALPEPTYTNVRCYVYTPRAVDVEDRGPGDQRIGHDKMFFEPKVDVQFNDIIKLTSGPNAGKIYKVTNSNRILNHHLEVTVDSYYGP